MKTVCIIEDEQDIIDALKTFFEDYDYTVQSFNSAENFYEGVDPEYQGLYLVDWNLPGEPGIEIIKKIRSRDRISPIFMVSAYSKKDDIIAGLRSGADDYITKPFNFEELLARADNATSKFNIVTDNLMEQGVKILDGANAIMKDGETINLTQREFVIFKYLFDNPNTPVNRDELIKQFSSDEMTVRNIDVHVFSLRKKLSKVGLRIDTVWGRGYRLPQ
jgi:two-component system response regulator BaeR